MIGRNSTRPVAALADMPFHEDGFRNGDVNRSTMHIHNFNIRQTDCGGTRRVQLEFDLAQDAHARNRSTFPGNSDLPFCIRGGSRCEVGYISGMHNKLAATHPDQVEHKGIVIDRECESANRPTRVGAYFKLEYPAEVWVHLRTKSERYVTIQSVSRVARRIGRQQARR